MARKKTKAYSEAFRKEAVTLADQPDRTATDVARELGISQFLPKRCGEFSRVPY